MIHVYKSGTDYKKDGKGYNIKCIRIDKLDEMLKAGWVRSLDEVKAPKAKKTKVNKDDNKK